MPKIRDNLRRLGGRVLDINPRAVAGSTIPTLIFTFGAKFQVWLIVAFHLAALYEEVIRDPTSTNALWGTVAKNFQCQ